MAQAEQQLILESDNQKRRQSIAKLVKNALFVLAIALCLIAVFIMRQAIARAPLAQVVVSAEGLTSLQYQQLNDAMQSQAGGSFFSSNLPAMREKARSFSWIDEVNITRNWNKGIVVEVLPKQPIARFGSEKVVDAKGQVYEPADIEALEDSDLVMLQGSPEQAEAIMQQMQQINAWYAPLGLSVEDIILTPRMTWLIRFDSGLRLLVDGENTSQKLLSVSQALQTQLSAELDKIQSIDLRYKNGFAIAWKPVPKVATAKVDENLDKKTEQDNKS